jgi:hypothetical protein
LIAVLALVASGAYFVASSQAKGYVSVRASTTAGGTNQEVKQTVCESSSVKVTVAPMGDGSFQWGFRFVAPCAAADEQLVGVGYSTTYEPCKDPVVTGFFAEIWVEDEPFRRWRWTGVVPDVDYPSELLGDRLTYPVVVPFLRNIQSINIGIGDTVNVSTPGALLMRLDGACGPAIADARVVGGA